MSDSMWFTIDGEECLDENRALAKLLNEDILFCNTRQFLDLNGKPCEYTTVLFVLCNDLFVWGCADAEPFTSGTGTKDEDLFKLYKLYEENKIYGPMKWCCLKRGEQPQDPIKMEMIKAGYWDAELEALRPNIYWTHLKKRTNNEESKENGHRIARLVRKARRLWTHK